MSEGSDRSSGLHRVDLKYLAEKLRSVSEARAKVEIEVDTFPGGVSWNGISLYHRKGSSRPKLSSARRVKLVYLVKVSIPNPDYDLKAGMPARMPHTH